MPNLALAGERNGWSREPLLVKASALLGEVSARMDTKVAQ
jgi:hypothetical protein